jgi:N-acetylgalactosamine kinase
MDQAISYLGQKDQASRIFFNPLRSEPMPLPEGATFIVAHSLVEANKYLSADTGYNMRVVECRLAAALLAKALNLNDVKILADVQKQSHASLAGCIEYVQKHLHKEPYSRSELATLLGISVRACLVPSGSCSVQYLTSVGECDAQQEDLVSKFIGAKIQSDKFLCYQRALHVYQESKLVEEFAEVCSGSQYAGEQKARTLGALMNQSHYSCRDNFECSCPELDTLTQIARFAFIASVVLR